MNALAINVDKAISTLAARYTSKLTAQDITVALIDVADAFLSQYTGSFTFVTNMVEWRKAGSLTAAQVAGVLNAAIADYRYAQRTTTPPVGDTKVYNTTTQVVADGWYTIVGPQGGHRTLRIETVEDGSPRQWLAYLCGQDNESEYKSVGFITGDKVELFRKYQGQYTDILAAARFLVRNADKVGEYGRQYALRSGKCYVCNRKLTTPESIANGIGPVCASKGV